MTYLKIGEFQLDIEHSQILANKEKIALEPKVLEVLLVLIEQPGSVVPTAKLIERVWGNAVVEPNALHRCIRQLRKAFNDNVQQQSYIKTHPRKGYSFVAQVHEENQTETGEGFGSKSDVDTIFGIKNKRIYLLSLFILLTFFVVLNSSKESKHIYQFNKLTSLTATDAIEANSVFSPDGKSVTFLREDKEGKDHIWWLNLETNEEKRLTDESGHYRNLAWSPKAKRIAFTRVLDKAANRCMQIESLYLPLAISSPQPSHTLIECDDNHYESPQWLDEHRFFSLQHSTKQSDVILFDIGSGERSIIFSDSDNQIHTIVMSQPKRQLAITILADQEKPKIFTYDVESKLIEPLLFNIPEKYSNYFHWHPIWDHLGDGFLFSVGRHLLHMDLTGSFTELHASDAPDLRLADMSPLGSSIVMTMGKADRDIYIHSLMNDKAAKVVGRSTVKEFAAKFNPVSEQIAFLSERYGSTNVWVEQAEEVKQISNILEGVEQFVWSPTGKELLLFHGGKLAIVPLNGSLEATPVSTNAEVTRIFQWFSPTQLLSSLYDNGEHYLVNLDIETGEVEKLYQGHVYWAQFDEQDLVISKQSGELFRVNELMATNLDIKQEIAPKSPFFIRDGKLFFLNLSKELYRFDLESKQTEHLTTFSQKDTWLNDIDYLGKKLLTSEIQVRQTELVSFHN